MTRTGDVESVLEELAAIYERSASNLREAIDAYVRTGERPTPEQRAQGFFAYPELRIDYEPSAAVRSISRAYGRLNEPGRYTSSIARPQLFRDYLAEQLGHLVADYGVKLSVGHSASEIPYPYVLDGSSAALGNIEATELARICPSTELVHIGDEVVDGLWQPEAGEPRPLWLFDGPRTDFSLARLRHYTGTPPEDFQHFVL